MEKKQDAAECSRQAACEAEMAQRQRTTRQSELDMLAEQQRDALAALQKLHEWIVQAPANVVNKAVLLFHHLHGVPDSRCEPHQGQAQNGAAQSATAQSVAAQNAAESHAACMSPPSDSLPSMPRPAPAHASADPIHLPAFGQAEPAACSGTAAWKLHLSHQPDLSAQLRSAGTQPQAHGAVHGMRDPRGHKGASTVVGSASRASVETARMLSFSDSESEPDELDAPASSLLHLSSQPRSQAQSATQLFARKLALKVLRAWQALRLAALEARVLADAIAGSSCMLRALRRWRHATARRAEWRRGAVQRADALRERMLASWVIHAWQAVVMDRRAVLHKFLLLRCAHSRRLQLAALAGLWMHAQRRRWHRAALCTMRQRAAARWLRAWQRVARGGKRARTLALLFVGARTQRVLEGCLAAWRARAARRRACEAAAASCVRRRARAQLRAAFAHWRALWACAALLRRVFAAAERAWEGLLQVGRLLSSNAIVGTRSGAQAG